MPEEIDTVDWSGLRHAYGSAEDVPALLGALASDDEAVRHEAFGELLASLVHQGRRDDASAYAVPTLLDLMADPATPDRYLVGLLLVWIAIGEDRGWLPDGLLVDVFRTRATGAEDLLPRYRRGAGLDDAEYARLDAYVALRAWEAVRAGLPVLRRLLVEDDDIDLRTIVAYTLGWFPPDAAPAGAEVPADTAASLAVLAEVAADAEQDEGLVAVAVVAAGLLGTDDGARVAATALDDGRAVVRWAGAVALARLHGPAADPRVATELLGWAGGDSLPDHRIPYLDGDLAGYAALALGQLGAAAADATFAACLARLPKIGGMEALTLVGEALRQAFPAGPAPAGTPFDLLDDRQRRLARVLAGSPDTWRYDEHEFGNFAELVGEYGLPDSHALLLRYVGGPTVVERLSAPVGTVP